MQYDDSFLLNWQPSIEFKLHDVKLSFFLLPLSKKLNKFDILLNSCQVNKELYQNNLKVEGKCNGNGDGHIKLIQD